MKKSLYLFGLASSLLLLGLAEAVSGFILWFALPSGGGRKGLESAYLGITRHTWIDIHDWVAIALMVIVIFHLALHWKWVLRMIKEIWNQLAGSYRIITQSLTKGANN
jgi:hypothetical protein